MYTIYLCNVFAGSLMHAYVYLIFCLNRNRLQCDGRHQQNPFALFCTSHHLYIEVLFKTIERIQR